MNPELTAPVASQDDATNEPGQGRRARPKFDNRFIAPLFITFMLLVGQLSYGILESYQKTLLAIASSIATEIILGRLMTGKWPHLASAYISGISVGILVRATAVWPYAWCAVVSIVSKYVLRLKGRHLWNPSNFGISALLFIAPFTGATLNVQWGNSIWPMLVIWTLGSIIIYRLKRFHISATYVAAFLLFALIRSQVTGHGFMTEVAPITGPMYQLFVFFMITDPKTTVQTKSGQCAVAVAVALVEMILRLMEVVHAPYYALFIVGPTANLIEISLASRRLKAAEPEPVLS
jgi:Na+-translocating ferredoxin:NAD+ oxidoreductase RnfD subunit